MQWLGLRTSTAEDPGLIPGQELRSCMLHGQKKKKRKQTKCVNQLKDGEELDENLMKKQQQTRIMNFKLLLNHLASNINSGCYHESASVILLCSLVKWR